MAIAPLQLPQLGAVSGGADFSPLANLGQIYQKAKTRQTLSELGQGLADGSIDFNTAAAKIAGTGDLDATYKFLQLAQAKKKQDDELLAHRDFTGAIGGMFSQGGEAPPPVASTPMRSMQPGVIPPASAPMSMNGRPPVASSPTVIGDDEGVRLGLYDKPAGPGQAPPQQPMTLASLNGGYAPDTVPPANNSTAMVRAQPAPAAPQDQRVAQVSPDKHSAPALPPVPGQLTQNPASGGNIQKLLAAAGNPRLPAADREVAKTLLSHALDSSKLTNEQKEYLWDRAQGGTETFTDWSRGNKASGRTQFTVDQRGETEEAKAAGKGAGERRATMFAAAGAASKTLTQLSRVEGLLGQVSQGKMEPARLSISAWAKSFGLNDEVATSLGLDPKGVGSAQALAALSNESVLGKIGPGGLPANNFSDADREFLTGTVQRLGNDPRANKLIIEVGRRVAQIDIERAKGYQKFKADPANKSKGFEDFELSWSEQVAKQDRFGDLRKEAESIVGPPRNDIGGTIQNPGAAPQRGPSSQGQPQQNAAPVRVRSPDEARKLPPGTPFISPDGREFIAR